MQAGCLNVVEKYGEIAAMNKGGIVAFPEDLSELLADAQYEYLGAHIKNL